MFGSCCPSPIKNNMFLYKIHFETSNRNTSNIYSLASNAHGKSCSLRIPFSQGSRIQLWLKLQLCPHWKPSSCLAEPWSLDVPCVASLLDSRTALQENRWMVYTHISTIPDNNNDNYDNYEHFCLEFQNSNPKFAIISMVKPAVSPIKFHHSLLNKNHKHPFTTQGPSTIITDYFRGTYDISSISARWIFNIFCLDEFAHLLKKS